VDTPQNRSLNSAQTQLAAGSWQLAALSPDAACALSFRRSRAPLRGGGWPCTYRKSSWLMLLPS